LIGAEPGLALTSAPLGAAEVRFGQKQTSISEGLLQEFGTIPSIGEHVEAHGWRFKIVDLDGRRIDKVLATKTDNPRASRV
jgi:CBS domain containing-hemolysin-like protein